MPTITMNPVFQLINQVNDFPEIKRQVKHSKIEKKMRVYKDLEMSLNFMGGLFSFLESKTKFLIEDTPDNKKIDDDLELVSSLENLEDFLKTLYDKLEPPPVEDEWALATYHSWKNICKSYAEIFQDIRWEILIHDGQLSMRTNKTFAGSEEYLTTLDPSL